MDHSRYLRAHWRRTRFCFLVSFGLFFAIQPDNPDSTSLLLTVLSLTFFLCFWISYCTWNISRWSEMISQTWNSNIFVLRSCGCQRNLCFHTNFNGLKQKLLSFIYRNLTFLSLHRWSFCNKYTNKLLLWLKHKIYHPS